MRPIAAVMHIMPMPMIVTVAVAVVRGSDILHLVDGAALGAALDGAVARGGEPEDDVRVRRAAGAADVLLVAEGFDADGVVEGACSRGVCVSGEGLSLSASAALPAVSRG